jgi:hypothetical protein
LDFFTLYTKKRVPDFSLILRSWGSIKLRLPKKYTKPGNNEKRTRNTPYFPLASSIRAIRVS